VDYRSAVNDETLRRYIDRSEHREILNRALAEFEKGNEAAGHAVLRYLVASSSPHALVIASMFSKQGEDEQDFVARHLVQLQKAASLGDPIAAYSIGVYLDQGDLLPLDKERAFALFKQAAELGMRQAMHIYGVMLYYGTGGAPLERAKGLSLVESAAAAGVEESKEFLASLK
jgi:TPR repeat protein